MAAGGLEAVQIPAAGVDELYFRDGKAKYGDIVWWPKGNAWKNQSLTPNTSVRYLYVFFNTKDDGPVVLDLPPAANGTSLLGTIADAWQVPLTDVGFEGNGGKYLVLPPNYTDEAPAGYIPVRSKTYNTFTTIRSILASNSEEDERKGDALVKQIKIYPLTKAGNPPAQRFVDMTDIMYDGLVHYDESIYTSLARMLNEGNAPNDRSSLCGGRYEAAPLSGFADRNRPKVISGGPSLFPEHQFEPSHLMHLFQVRIESSFISHKHRANHFLHVLHRFQNALNVSRYARFHKRQELEKCRDIGLHKPWD